MKTIIKLTICGDAFFFEDNGFTLEDKQKFQNIADIISQKKLELKISNEKDLCSLFINEVKESSGITLVPVVISIIIRIN